MHITFILYFTENRILLLCYSVTLKKILKYLKYFSYIFNREVKFILKICTQICIWRFQLPFLLVQHAVHAQYWNLTVMCQSISFPRNKVRFVYLLLWHKSPALTIVITKEEARKEPVWTSKHHTFPIHSALIS